MITNKQTNNNKKNIELHPKNTGKTELMTKNLTFESTVQMMFQGIKQFFFNWIPQGTIQSCEQYITGTLLFQKL